MGNSILPCPLNKPEINDLMTKTVFSAQEIRCIWFHFNTISDNSQSISRSQFQAAMLFKDSTLLDQIFRVFDTNDDDKISFHEYLSCLSIISNKASRESKHLFSFNLYDFDNDGYISVEDLTAVLASTLRENGLVISRTQIDEIVKSTMKEAQPVIDGKISYEE